MGRAVERNGKKNGKKLLGSIQRAKISMKHLMTYLNGICMCLGCGCERGNSSRRNKCFLPALSECSELNPGIVN